MWKRTTLAVLGVLLVASPGVAGNGKDTQWLHVAVDGTEDDPEHVRINVPLGLLEAILPLIEESEFRHGRIDIDGEEFDREDIVTILRELRDAEDGEYVTVKDRYSTVRVAKVDNVLTVKIDEERRRSTEHVDLRIPLPVLEALVSGGDDELDVLAAVRALGEHADGNLITVDDDGTQVRIWIDRETTSE